VVTYVFPIIGLLLGIVFLNERPDWRLFVGTALIVAGILVLNVLGGRRLRNQRIPGHARPA